MTFSSATLLQVKGNFQLVTLELVNNVYTTCLLSVSGDSQDTLMLEAEPGDNVTLQCHSNLIDLWSYIHWFKQINTSAPEFLLYIHYASQMVLYSEDVVSKGPGRITGFVNKTKSVFLMINEVNSSDSGLYFCGIQRRHGHLTFSSATLLQVKGNVQLLTLDLVNNISSERN
uniref:Ig-like domain-containing protein n=1 Tax=Pygocentrus nattereri TaxID=42514 RepID=A0A3B4DM34_PYGNA